MTKKPPVASRRRSSVLIAAAVKSFENERRLPNHIIKNEEKRKEYEKYHCTGVFEKDFVDLCSFLDIQVTVQHRGSGLSKTKDERKTPYPPVTETSKTREVKYKLPHPETHTISEEEINDPFHPFVGVETENEFNVEYVKEIYLRGWRVDDRVLAVMTLTLSELEKLTVLNMWNVGLTDKTLEELGKCLSSSPNLKTLLLDGNNQVSGQRFDILLTPDTLNLQHLSLRSCGINETGGINLGESLASNTSLLTLNLCFNKLGNNGVYHISDGLRVNRRLLSLNLGSNDIGDEGAKHLAETLSSFSLTDAQVVSRRLQLSKFSKSEFTSMSNNDRASVHSSRRAEKETEGSRRKSSSTPKVKQKRRSVSRTPDKSNEEYDQNIYAANPLLAAADEINGQLWIPGNRSLININLSRNTITKTGLQFLYSAIKFQIDSVLENNIEVNGTGLFRICLQKNCFTDDDPTFSLLSDIMKTQDPLYKRQSLNLIADMPDI